MNCRDCQRDMSQCLDGRLPSGRRTAVMQHLETCEECSQLWSEFRQAQELALRLPVTRVSPDFHARLWERIKAGEGTPEAVFNEPMPLSTKARYVFTGAAAAALLLVVLNGWVPGTGGSTAGDDGELFGGFTLATSEPMPFEPQLVAQEAAKHVAREFQTLDLNSRKLASLPQGRLDEPTFRAINESARGLRSMGRVILLLKQDQHLDMPTDMEVKLRLMQSSLDVNKLNSLRDTRELYNMLSSLVRQLRDLELLPERIRVRPFYRLEERHEFWRKAGDWFVEDRDLQNYIHIQFPEQQSLRVRVLSPDGLQVFFNMTRPQGSR